MPLASSELVLYSAEVNATSRRSRASYRVRNMAVRRVRVIRFQSFEKAMLISLTV